MAIHFPQYKNLPVEHLSSIFKHTTTTYKYYWFLALIDLVKDGETVISKQSIFAKLIAKAWHTTLHSGLNFGHFDQLNDKMHHVMTFTSLFIDTDETTVYKILSNVTEPRIIETLMELDKNVPHRFLSPWFPKKDHKYIYHYTQEHNHQAMYTLYGDHIVIHPTWAAYIQHHAASLKSYTYEHLEAYLKVRNPAVKNIQSIH